MIITILVDPSFVIIAEGFVKEIWHLIGTCPSSQEPLHRGHEIQKFGRPLLCQYRTLRGLNEVIAENMFISISWEGEWCLQ